MRTYKKIDCWVSIMLIGCFTAASLVRQDETIFYGYFTVGGWHIISMIIHGLNNWFTERGSQRLIYHWIVFWLFILTVSGFLFFPIIIMMAYLMLFAAPFMAIYYTWLCYDETYVKMRRPLSALK